MRATAYVAPKPLGRCRPRCALIPGRHRQSGRTALHWAISNGRDDVVNVLLANGADIERRDEVGVHGAIDAWIVH